MGKKKTMMLNTKVKDAWWLRKHRTRVSCLLFSFFFLIKLVIFFLLMCRNLRLLLLRESRFIIICCHLILLLLSSDHPELSGRRDVLPYNILLLTILWKVRSELFAQGRELIVIHACLWLVWTELFAYS